MAEKIITRMAIFVIMRDKQGRILLQQRTNTGYLDGYYDLACSGHVDEGESIRGAAVRELLEEIGVVAQEADLKLVHINQNFVDHTYTSFTFELSRWQGEPSICEPHKCSDLQYFNLDELPEKCTLSVRVNQRANFRSELSYSMVTKETYDQYMNETT